MTITTSRELNKDVAHAKRAAKSGPVFIVEAIPGAQRDPVFGTIVMFGLAGIFVETLTIASGTQKIR